MPVPVQDFKKVLDLTGLTTITASQVDQLLDTAIPADSRGLVVESSDTALNTPVVPDAVGTTKYKRYIWKRVLFDNSTKLYYWKESAASDATFLKWIELNAEIAGLQSQIDDAVVDANAAVADSANALSTAQTSQAIAQQALDAASAASLTLAALQTTVNNIQTSIVNAVYQVADIRWSAKVSSYSLTTNEGWLPCTGIAVSRAIFSALFAVIGTSFGAGDGVTTFNVPDLRGRTSIGTGEGVGLTDRVLGDSIGEENHVLVEAELPKHKHRQQCADVGTEAIGGGGANRRTFGTVAGPFIDSGLDTLETGNDEGHNNMQPSLALNAFIKT